MRARSRSLVLVAAAGLLPGPALGPLSAQVEEPAASGGPRFERFDFSDAEQVGVESLSLLTVPVTARAEIARRVTVELTGAFASAALGRPDGSESTLSGLTDTELTVSAPLAGDAVVVTGVAVLPTGKASLDPDEAAVAGAIAADLLPFSITHWGTGGGVGGRVAVARPLGALGVGLSVGYLVAGEYEPRSDAPFRYRPGNSLEVNAVVDGSVGAAGKASLRLSARTYSDDELDERNLYSSGNRYEVLGSYAFALGARSSGIAYAGFLQREEGTYLIGSRTAPSQDLVVAGGSVRMPLSRLVVAPDVSLRIFRREDGIGQGYAASVGGAVEWPLGRSLLVPTARVRFGSVEVFEGRESGLLGAELGVSVRVR